MWSRITSEKNSFVELFDVLLFENEILLIDCSSARLYIIIHGDSFCFRPRGGVGSEQPPSSDSDDYATVHRQGAGSYGQNLDVYTVPKVQVSGPSNANESASVING